MSCDGDAPPQIPSRTLRAFSAPASALQNGHAGFVFSCSRAADKLSLHDTNSGDRIISLDAPAQRPSRIAVSADGVKCAFATATGAVYIWDVLYPTSMESFRPDEDNSSPVTDLAWHPRGHVLAVATEAGNIYLWDHVVGALLFPLPAHTGSISAVRWTAHGRLLVTVGASDTLLRVWNPRNVNNLADVSASSEHTTPAKWHVGGITCLDTLQDMSRVAITGAPDGSVLLSVLKPESQCGVFASMNSHDAPVHCVRFAPIGSPRPLRSASAADDGSIHLFDMERRLPMGKFSHANKPVVQLEFSHHADVLFSAAGDTVIAWDARVAPEEEPPITFGAHQHAVNSFALVNSGANLVTACEDGMLRTYDMRYPSGEPPPLPEIKSD
ncbi:POC1 centriolar protein-like [Gracilariopsis chorda]|uniref:POC1 centriolar protein-like n=1 Tax=Gracilariopsis chorda TaxID=448386 RepID=A0A2V3IZ29_9FLOR|nr:POC1 centriolar protein-like [Gracilariopsis chorda]|eukprot:PXF47325.1 POC1 centriolar protein-like [Gracilariopsis chorda]